MKDFLTQPERSRDRAAPRAFSLPRASAPARPASTLDEASAQRAFELFLATGALPGRCQRNWEQAERDQRRQAMRETAGPRVQTSVR